MSLTHDLSDDDDSVLMQLLLQ